MPIPTTVPRRAPTLLLVALALAAGGCDRSGDTDGSQSARATDQPPRLELAVSPANGDAPLAVRLMATLEGEVAEPERFACPSLAWTLGNGDVVLARAADCGAGGVLREFELTYTYDAAGAYDASVRLLALDVPRSNSVSVLVRGPTATPAAVAAVPGPTIVIATAAAPTATPELPATATAAPIAAAPTATTAATALTAASPTAPAAATASPAPTAVALAPAESTAAPVQPIVATVTAGQLPATARATVPRGTASLPTILPPTVGPPVVAAGQVLPADLYFATRRPAGLWRLLASGGPPEAVVADQAVADYAVAANGLVAYVTAEDGALYLLAPGTQPVRLVPSDAGAPVWSPDGRRLAYGADGVTVYDLATARRGVLAPAGEPLAWSRDGQWLAVRRADGGLTLASSSGARTDLPVGPVTAAGWLPDRNVLWLAGAGLELLTVGDTLELATLLGPDVRVRAATTTADGRLLALADTPTGPRLHVTDLSAEVLVPEVAGPALVLPAPQEDVAWAPDGQTLAVAEPNGLRLLAPATGADLPLYSALAERPRWVLGVR